MRCGGRLWSAASPGDGSADDLTSWLRPPAVGDQARPAATRSAGEAGSEAWRRRGLGDAGPFSHLRPARAWTGGGEADRAAV